MRKKCTNPLCDSNDIYCRGLCCACYQYQRKTGEQRDPRIVHRGASNRIDLDNLPTLIRRYRRGATLAELAPLAGVSTTTLGERLREAGVKLRPPAPRRKMEEGEIVLARELYHNEGVPMTEIAERLEHNYWTIRETVKGRVNLSVGGPLPQSDEDELSPCQRCGILCKHNLCRYCRKES